MGLGLTDSGIGINASYHPKHGLSGGIGVKSDLGVAAGLNFSRDGPSAYAGMVLNEEGTQSAGISYSKDEGAGAYYERGFTESGSGRLTFNQRDGFGAGLQIDNVDMSISERGGASIEATVALDDVGFEEEGPTGYNQNSNLRMGYNTKRGYNVNLDVTTSFNDGSDGFSGSIGYQQHQGLTSSINTDLNRNFSAGSEYMISSQAGLRGTVSGIAAQKQKEYQQQQKLAWLDDKWDLLEAADPDKYNAATRAAILSDQDAFSDALHDAGLAEAEAEGRILYEDERTTREGLWDNIVGGFEDAYRGVVLGQISDSDGFIDSEGNYRQRTCFVAGTLVRVHPETEGAFREENGSYYKKIEDIQTGDLVLSWDEETDEISYQPVTQTFIRTTEEIYRITLEDGTLIETTWSHRFWVLEWKTTMTDFAAAAVYSNGTARGHWEIAENLQISDSFLTTDGNYIRIAAIERIQKEETVYNFTVKSNSTYFVSATGVLVHNENYSEGATWLNQPLNASALTPERIQAMRAQESISFANAPEIVYERCISEDGTVLFVSRSGKDGKPEILEITDYGTVKQYVYSENGQITFREFNGNGHPITVAHMHGDEVIGGTQATHGARIPNYLEGATRITSGFGVRKHPITGESSNHNGLDITIRGGGDAPGCVNNGPCDLQTNAGNFVPTVANGRVTWSGPAGGAGNMVVIDHDLGVQTVYMHNSQTVVSTGDSVSAGQVLAVGGTTGQSTGSHIHFEVRKNGVPINPLTYDWDEHERIVAQNNAVVPDTPVFETRNDGTIIAPRLK